MVKGPLHRLQEVKSALGKIKNFAVNNNYYDYYNADDEALNSGHDNSDYDGDTCLYSPPKKTDDMGMTKLTPTPQNLQALMTKMLQGLTVIQMLQGSTVTQTLQGLTLTQTQIPLDLALTLQDLMKRRRLTPLLCYKIKTTTND